MGKAEGQQTDMCPSEVPGLSFLTSTARVKLSASSDPAPASWSSSWLGSVPAAAYENYQVIKAEFVLPKEGYSVPLEPRVQVPVTGLPTSVRAPSSSPVWAPLRSAAVQSSSLNPHPPRH